MYQVLYKSWPRSNTTSRLKRFEHYHEASLSSDSLAVSLLRPTWRCRCYMPGTDICLYRSTSTARSQEDVNVCIPTCSYTYDMIQCNIENLKIVAVAAAAAVQQYARSPHHARSRWAACCCTTAVHSHRCMQHTSVGRAGDYMVQQPAAKTAGGSVYDTTTVRCQASCRSGSPDC